MNNVDFEIQPADEAPDVETKRDQFESAKRYYDKLKNLKSVRRTCREILPKASTFSYWLQT